MLVMMVMMVVMVMMFGMTVELNAAVGFVTGLPVKFKLYGNVIDSVLLELFAYLMLYVVSIFSRHRVKSSIMQLTVKAPYVYVMYLDDAIDLLKVFFYFGYVYFARSFFKEEIERILKIANRVYN